MNFKRGKKKDRTSSSDWKESAYERKQARRTRLDLTEKPIPAKLPKNYCKKLKKEHDFVLVKEEKMFWSLGVMYYYSCSGCKKKKLRVERLK